MRRLWDNFLMWWEEHGDVCSEMVFFSFFTLHLVSAIIIAWLYSPYTLFGTLALPIVMVVLIIADFLDKKVRNLKLEQARANRHILTYGKSGAKWTNVVMAMWKVGIIDEDDVTDMIDHIENQQVLWWE